jgi:GNAT superfamily N-acetyltransferase
MSAQPSVIVVREMVPADAESASRFVADVFRRQVAPLYAAEGVAEFLAYVAPHRFASRMLSRHVGFVAEDQNGQIVGLVEIRDFSHISLLFVSTARQRHGIGRRLLAEAVARCMDVHPEAAELTVNASPNSVPAYTRYGFVPIAPEQEMNGIRFVPMQMLATPPGGNSRLLRALEDH